MQKDVVAAVTLRCGDVAPSTGAPGRGLPAAEEEALTVAAPTPISLLRHVGNGDADFVS